MGRSRQELVFVSSWLDEATITAELNACLADLDDGARKDLQRWAHLPDPLPRLGLKQRLVFWPQM